MRRSFGIAHISLWVLLGQFAILGIRYCVGCVGASSHETLIVLGYGANSVQVEVTLGKVVDDSRRNHLSGGPFLALA